MESPVPGCEVVHPKVPISSNSNILSGVGQFALENNLVEARSTETEIAVFMENSNQVAQVTVATPNGQISYKGDAQIDGVPGTAAAVLQNFPEAAGSSCGAICTRTFIPHRCHASIGVLGAVSVATACMMPDSPAAALCDLPTTGDEKMIQVEHPIGATGVLMHVTGDGSDLAVHKAAILRTARKLMSGVVFPSA